MKYELSKLTNSQVLQLPKVTVPNQDSLTEKFGKTFSVSENYALVSDVTNGFKKPITEFKGENKENLEKVDKLTYNVLVAVGFFEDTKKAKPKEATKPKEEPKPKPKPTKASETKRIDLLERGLKYIKGEKRQKEQKRIDLLKKGLKYLK